MITWLRRYWSQVLIILLLIAFIRTRAQFGLVGSPNRPISLDQQEFSAPVADMGMKVSESRAPMIEPEVPPSDSQDRLVITDTSLSMVVNDVSQTVKDIQAKAESLGGFLVRSNVNTPEEGGTGNITVRVSSDKLSQALDEFKTLGVKTTSEKVSGTDVTDQYEDLDAKLTTLNATKAKFSEIMDQATDIDDILQVQRELVNLQRQIDSLVGRKQYLEKSARLSTVTAYLSTDELALPYAPDDLWRPSVVFKTAVRSLVQTGRGVINGLIWLVVYAPVWLPIWLLWRYLTRK